MQCTDARHECSARMQSTNANTKAGCPNCVSYDVVNFGWQTYFSGKIGNFSGYISRKAQKNKVKTVSQIFLCLNMFPHYSY